MKSRNLFAGLILLTSIEQLIAASVMYEVKATSDLRSDKANCDDQTNITPAKNIH